MPEVNFSQPKPQPKPAVNSAPTVAPTVTPKVEPRFQIPQRRNYIKYIATLIVLVIVLACAWIAYSVFSKPAMAPVTPVQQDEPAAIPSGARYYLAYDSEKYEEARIYQYSADSTKPDIKIGEIQQKNLSVLGKYVKPYTYVVSDSTGKLQILDATTAKLEPLFELPDPQTSVRNVALSKDKQWLAYGRNFEGGEAGGSGELWLYNVETKQQRELVKKMELGIYQGFSVLGWRGNDKELIVSALGGDAGAVWGDIYTVNVASGKIDKVAPPEIAEKDMTGFILGQLSPDGDKWLFKFCAEPDATFKDNEEEAWLNACTSGTELRTYDFASKEMKTVYQNLRYGDNADKSLLRTFMDFIWEDDDTVVAAVPGAVLSIPVGNPSKTTELFVYDRYEPQKFKDNFIGLVEANGNQVAFTRNDSWHVFDRDSKKTIDLDPTARREAINFWLD